MSFKVIITPNRAILHFGNNAVIFLVVVILGFCLGKNIQKIAPNFHNKLTSFYSKLLNNIRGNYKYIFKVQAELMIFVKNSQ